MLFAVFDHNDATGRPPGRQLDERLELVAEARARTRFGRYGIYDVTVRRGEVRFAREPGHRSEFMMGWTFGCSRHRERDDVLNLSPL